MESPEAFAVRSLGPDDIDSMRALLHVFGTAFDDPETYDSRQPGAAYLERLLGSECFVSIAAFSDGRVVGGLAAYVLHKFEQERSEIYIYDLAVIDDFRRRGIATALIRALKRIAKDRGAWVVFVQADVGDDPAIELYSGLGTREDVLQFDIVPE